ncbi:MAG: hypothetical protein GC185_07170 [Alphaproteobacteria bacterium]|nr:hypothetical protein [Alphaproteobacteria bacterium]
MRKMTSLMLALMLTTAMPQAYAADVDAKGAETLRQTVEDSMAYPKALAEHNMEGLTLGGPVTVTPKDGYYEVRLPDVVLKAPNVYALKIGTIVANMSPGEDGSYMTTLALPSPIEIDDGKGAKVGDITIGSQHFTGTWRPDLATLTQMDAEYKDVSAKSSGETPLSITIPDIKSTMDLKKDGPDTWSGPISVDMNGLAVSGQGPMVGDIEAKLARLQLASTVNKMNLTARKTAQDKLIEAIKQSSPDGAQTSPEDASKITASMMTAATGYLDGMDTTYGIEGLDMTFNPPKDADPAAKPLHVTLGKFTSHAKTAGLQSDKGSANATLNFADFGFDGGGPKDILADAIPASGNLDIAFANLPMKTMGETLTNAVSQVVQSSFSEHAMPDTPGDIAARAAMRQQASMQMMSSLATIPAALASAGATVKISDTHFDAKELTTKLDGEFAASMTSPLKAVGHLDLSFVGLDELLQKVQALSQAPDSSPHLMGAAQWLSILQMMGQVEKSPDGRTVRVFKFELTPEGQPMMNGQPMGQVMGAAGSMMQAHKPPPQ